MPRAKNAKVWNEDLVRALRAREEQGRQQGSQRQFLWRDGAAAIEAVRTDIYVFQSSGKIVGLPRKLSKTVEEECRGIIQGHRPILPEGYIPITMEDRRLVPQGNPYDQDPYLKKIKMQGGAYAILLAFHLSQSSTMTKEQICAAAQPHCDEQMDANWHAGRSYGAWSSKKTLVKHNLLQENKATQNGERGFRSTGALTWTLTDNGKLFIQALLRKFPQRVPTVSQEEVEPSDSVACGTDRPPSTYHNVQLRVHATNIVADSHPAVQVTPLGEDASFVGKKRDQHFVTDREELVAWISEGGSHRQKKFKVGAARRERLHTLCDELMEKYPGLVLQRKTEEEVGSRALYVFIKEKAISAHIARGLFGNKEPSKIKTSPSKRDVGRQLNSDTPPKRSRHTSSNAVARQALYESPKAELLQKASEPWGETKPSAARSLFSDGTSSNLLSSPADSDDDIQQAIQESLRQGRGSKAGPLAKRETACIELSDSEEEGEGLTSSLQESLFSKPAYKSLPKLEWPSSSESDDELLNHAYRPIAKRKKEKNLSVLKRKPCVGQGCKAVSKTEKQVKTEKAPVVIDLAESDEETTTNSHQVAPPAVKITIKDEKGSPDTTKVSEQKKVAQNKQASDQSNLVILIDNRERSRNATPREMRIELTRHLTSGSLNAIWPQSLPAGDVEEEQLNYGDFAFEVRDGLHHTSRLPISVERKRVNDLVQRSVNGDHWKQLQRMRDCCDVAVMLIEGDTRTACQFPADGSQHQDWSPDHHTIDDEPTLYRFMARAILSSPAIMFIQAKDEQASYRAVGVLGLVATLYDNWTKEAPHSAIASKAAINKLYQRLNSRGIHWRLARRVSEEVGSISQIERIYEECEQSRRHEVLSPIISNTCSSSVESEGSMSLLECGSVSGWSTAVYSAIHSSLPEPSRVRQKFDEYKVFVEDQAGLLKALHSGKSPESIVEQALEIEPQKMSPRIVRVEGPSDLVACLPQVESDTFYKPISVERNHLGLSMPTVVMQTVSGRSRSHRLCLHVIEARSVVESIQKACIIFHKDFISAAREVAKDINARCSSDKLKLLHDRRVLVVRGLGASIDAAAKKAGYIAEIKTLVDAVFAELMIRHGIVVVQAVRLSSDLEMIIKEFAFACFHYQLLTQSS
jgi:hypothetical protein